MSNEPMIIMILIATAILILLSLVIFALMSRFYHKVHQGQALVINKPSGNLVSFTGAFVMPVICRAEYIDISIKPIELVLQGHDGLLCKDNIYADLHITFFVRVNRTQDDVLRVASTVGCERASQAETIKQLFGAKFSGAIKSAGCHFDFKALYKDRETFRDRIIETVGYDLNGYILEDVGIDSLERTPARLARSIEHP